MDKDYIRLEKEEFEKMTDRIVKQDEIIKQLKEDNQFLNDQIKEYNEKFAGVIYEKH